MKHLRLFLVAIATVFGLSANAQNWQADEVGAGYALLYNVGTGQFLTRGNGWGTQASVSPNNNPIALKVELYDGVYKLRTDINGSGKGLEHLNGGTIYTDQSAGKNSTWDFVQVGTDNGPVYNIKSVDNHGGGAGIYLTALEGGTIVGPGSDGTTARAQWKVLSLDKDGTIVGNATEENPLDVTFLIKNHNFSYTLIQPWTMVASNQNLSGGAEWNPGPGNPGAESWRAAFTLSQTINVPNGKYQLTAQAAVTEYDVTGQDLPVVYANDETATFKAMTAGEASMTAVAQQFSAGKYIVGPINVTVTDGKLTVGVRGTRTNTWCMWDNFQLTYFGEVTDLSELEAALAAAVAAATALEGTIPDAAYQALAAIVAENNKEYTNADGYSAAINAIKAATETAQALQAPFSRYNEVKAACKAVYGELDSAAADEQANAATSAEAIEAAVAAVRQALLSYVSTVEKGEFDLTNAIIDNPTVSQNINYWTIENLSADGGSAGVTNYGETEFYQRTFDFFQTLKGLPVGTYEFGVTGFHRAGNHSTYFYAGEDKILIPGVSNTEVNSMADAKTYFDNGNGKVALKFALEGETNDIKVGIVNNDTETDKWTIFRNFTLKYYGSYKDYSIYADDWAKAVAAANAAIAANPNVTGEELAAVNAAIADEPDGSSKANYLEKTNALLAATQAFIAAAPAYNAYVAEKAIAQMIGVTPGEENPTSAAAAVAGTNDLKVAEFNYVKDNYQYDYEPVIGTFGEWTGTATVAGEPATPNYLSNEHWSGQTHAYYEQASTGWGNPNGWTIKYEKTAKLPAGDYMLKVAARSSEGTTSLVSCTATTNTVTLPANGASTRGINTSGIASWSDSDIFAAYNENRSEVITIEGGTGFGWEWRYLPFTLTEPTEVTMTFYAEATTQYQWMSIADGTLLSKQEIQNSVQLNDLAEAAPEAEYATEITYDRTLVPGFNTLVLPFNIDATELGENVDAIYAYGGSNITGEGENAIVHLDFSQAVTSLAQNKPYIVKVKENSPINGLEFEKKYIQPAENPTITDANFDFVGTYVALPKGNETIVAGDYISVAAGLKAAAGGNKLNAFRAYLKKKAEVPAGAKVAIQIGDDIVDGIEAAQILNNVDGTIYNLNGQKVTNAQKGIFIQNGKKVVIK